MKTKDFIQSMKRESVFCAFEEAKAAISDDEELLARIAAFQREHKTHKDSADYDKQRELSTLYWNLLIDERAKAYLAAESAAAAALYGVLSEIAGAVDINADFCV